MYVSRVCIRVRGSYQVLGVHEMNLFLETPNSMAKALAFLNDEYLLGALRVLGSRVKSLEFSRIQGLCVELILLKVTSLNGHGDIRRSSSTAAWCCSLASAPWLVFDMYTPFLLQGYADARAYSSPAFGEMSGRWAAKDSAKHPAQTPQTLLGFQYEAEGDEKELQVTIALMDSHVHHPPKPRAPSLTYSSG